jgi:hypothetical protein
MTGPEAAASAAAALERANQQQENWSHRSGQLRFGIFGNGMPEALIAASGAMPVHLSMGITTEHHPIEAVIEPFVDEEVRHFLIRLMRGDFAKLSGIIFARDDAPALIAYQYATEWIRQGLDRAATPPLFLWNLVHTTSGPVQNFNRIQADKLFSFLAEAGGSYPEEADLAKAALMEARRRTALQQLQASVGQSLSGATAAIWRNAGRFMGAEEHAGLLTAALETPPEPLPSGVRIGLVGSPLACTRTYRMIEQFGTVVADQQPFGQMWPGPVGDATRLDEILKVTAADPSCPRITPTSAYRAALVQSLRDANCTLVVCQLAQTDDTFGWELPALFAELAHHGIDCINLGFRDARPDDTWLEQAARLISHKLEAHK